MWIIERRRYEFSPTNTSFIVYYKSKWTFSIYINIYKYQFEFSFYNIWDYL